MEATREHRIQLQKHPAGVPQSYQKNRRTIAKSVGPIRKRADSSVRVSRTGKPVIFCFYCGLSFFDHHFDALNLTQQPCTGMERITSEARLIVAFPTRSLSRSHRVYPDSASDCSKVFKIAGSGVREIKHAEEKTSVQRSITDYDSDARFHRSKSVYEIWLPPKRSKATLPTVTSNLPELASRIRFKSSIDATPPA